MNRTTLLTVTCESCGAKFQVQPEANALAPGADMCPRCYDFAVAIAKLEPNERDYLWHATRHRKALPHEWWWLVGAAVAIAGMIAWRFWI